MGFPTKVQLIKRKKSQQWYINFPAAVAKAMEFKQGEVVEWSIENKALLVLIAKAMEFKQGEVVEWSIENKALLVLKRTQVPDSPLKKKRTNSPK